MNAESIEWQHDVGRDELDVSADEDVVPEWQEPEVRRMPASYQALKAEYPALSAEEEVSLGFAIRAGRVAASDLVDREARGSLDLIERRRLLAIKTQGEQARQRMILSNMGLVYSIAGHYAGKGVEWEDLIQSGLGAVVNTAGEAVVGGLMHAVDKFDPASGNKFSTYATWWIRQAMSYTVAVHNGVIRLPAKLDQQVRILHAQRQKMFQETGKEPSDKVLAEAVGASESEVGELRVMHDIYRGKGSVLSIDETIDAEGRRRTLGDSIPSPGVDPGAEDGPLLGDTKLLLGALTLRQAYAIKELALYELAGEGSLVEITAGVGAGYNVPTLRRDVRVASKALLEYAAISGLGDGHWLLAYARRQLAPPNREMPTHPRISLEALTHDESLAVVTERALLTMAQKAYEPLRLLYQEGMTVEATAAELGISVRAVRLTDMRSSATLLANAQQIAAGGFDYAAWQSADMRRLRSPLGLLTAIGERIPGKARLPELESVAVKRILESTKLSPDERNWLARRYGLQLPADYAAVTAAAPPNATHLATLKLRGESQQLGTYIEPASQEGSVDGYLRSSQTNKR